MKRASDRPRPRCPDCRRSWHGTAPCNTGHIPPVARTLSDLRDARQSGRLRNSRTLSVVLEERQWKRLAAYCLRNSVHKVDVIRRGLDLAFEQLDGVRSAEAPRRTR
mgnify:FL=1